MATVTPAHTETEHAPEAFIEADDSASSDAGYESGLASDTTSLRSSVLRHVEENGRTYHRYKDGKYLSPNDEAERDRLDFYHAALLEMLGGKLHLAPIGDNPHRILDCGTGTGIWALDIGDKYPSAEVIGVDLSPIQPNFVFPNVRFEIDDLEDDWTFPPNHFDLIYTRTVITGIRDLQRYVKQMYTHCKPGGYFEFAESGFDIKSDDGSMTPETGIGNYVALLLSAGAKAGIKFPDENDIARYAREAGFVDIEIKRFKQPWGPWPKDKRLKRVGLLCAAVLDQSLESYSLGLFTRFGDLTEEDARKVIAKAKDECLNKRGVHAYNHMWYVYGRKPENTA